MEEATELLIECSKEFSKTHEYRILKTYRMRNDRLSFDERYSIAKSVEKSFEPFFTLLKTDASTLTDSDLLYCALMVMRIDRVAIAECLTVSTDAIRMRKLRLREKLPTVWFELMFAEQKRNCSDNVTSQNSWEQTPEIPLPAESTKIAKVMKQKMSFGKAVESCFSKYFKTEGRARRSEYWYFVLFCLIVNVSFTLFHNIVKGFVYPAIDESTVNICGIIIRTIDWIISIAFLCPVYSVTVRRLHDLDDNGWLAIILCLLPWAIVAATKIFVQQYGDTISLMAESSKEVTMKIVRPFLALVMGKITILIIKIILFSKPGTEGPNDFGPDPIRIISDTTDEESDS
jgi:uncharacterized membrane protein YhaH (DUF805 family)